MGTSRGLLVLGMHRSGTSCLTGLLTTAGAWVGAPAEVEAAPRRGRHNEDVEVRKLNERLLRAAGGSWHTPPASIDVDGDIRAEMQALLARYAGQALWVLKDPRMLLVLERWLPVLSGVEFVGTFRHPMAVARSHLRRDAMAIERGLQLWHRYNLELVRHHRRQGFALVSFDRAGEAYLRQFEKLVAQLGLPYDADQARAFYVSQFIRNAGEEGEAVPPELVETYDYLVENAIPLAS